MKFKKNLIPFFPRCKTSPTLILLLYFSHKEKRFINEYKENYRRKVLYPVLNLKLENFFLPVLELGLDLDLIEILVKITLIAKKISRAHFAPYIV